MLNKTDSNTVWPVSPRKANPLICFALSMVLLISCGKKPGVRGIVTDPGGKGLAGVTVSIPNSAFKGLSDQDGSYFLDFAPGNFKVLFTKEHYTTCELELNLTQKTFFPADTIKLFPIPVEKGVFWLTGGQTFQLQGVSVMQREWSQSWPLRNFRTCFIEYADSMAVSIPPGRITFIDSHPQPMRLIKIGANGIVESFSYSFGDTHFDYRELMTDTIERIGKERLVLRTVELSIGDYAWTPLYQTFLGEVHVQAGKPAFFFRVGPK